MPISCCWGQASSQLPVRRVVMRSSDDSRMPATFDVSVHACLCPGREQEDHKSNSRTVGMAEAPQGARQQDPLLDERRQQLQGDHGSLILAAQQFK
ncbi:hypothetical protein AK812_SmicGene29310 [Symbiodinium microadriaticum]|uniref:Uncharacterized protein n=1 Tax=Symbiodinium microadriaticum TaxID=2951 RepID=A0A1Q9D242_SYMMI|nr:hypothetical protein AK812_SmicGene29310 [Symbiodinium microadriaticum]